MNREMNKKDRQMTDEQVKELLLSCHKEGTLAVNGDDGYPYCVPINFVYVNDAIYMHSAKYGYKIDALNISKKACFSVVPRAEVAPELFTTRFESIIAFGDIEFIEDEGERQQVMEAFIDRYAKDFHEGGMKFIKASIGKTAVLKLNIKEMKGKAFRSDKW